MQNTDIRSSQIEEGRRMARYERDTPETFAPSTRRITVNGSSKGHPSSKSKSPKKPEGHESFLKQLETSGASIRLLFPNGESICGQVRHSDKYTISIRPEGGSTQVYFKHALEGFEPLTPAPERTEEIAKAE